MLLDEANMEMNRPRSSKQVRADLARSYSKLHELRELWRTERGGTECCEQPTTPPMLLCHEQECPPDWGRGGALPRYRGGGARGG